MNESLFSIQYQMTHGIQSKYNKILSMQTIAQNKKR